MNSNIRWPDNTLPVEVYCAPGVLTGLEVMAADGLLALPRIGLGIGGLLVGRRLDGGVEIARLVSIDCSHALGPAFVLTAEELAAGSGAAADGVVGWYCSKTRGSLDLTEQDRALFDALCPERWQVALLIQPCKGKVTRAVFGLRGESTFLLGIPRDLAWQELAAFQVATPPRVAVRPPVAEPIVTSPVSEPIAEIPVTMPRSGTLFGIPDAPVAASNPRRWPKRLLVAVVLFAILAAAFLTHESWMPK